MTFGEAPRSLPLVHARKTSERGAPFTTAGWRKMVSRLGVAAKLGFKAHPHMFRHACGFQLANQGTDTRTLQAYLGHRNIQHTVRYTERSPARFKNPLARLNIVSAMTCGLRVTRRRWHSGTGTKR
jgi:integrase